MSESEAPMMTLEAKGRKNMRIVQALSAAALACAVSVLGMTAAYAEGSGGGAPCAPDCVRVDSPGQSSTCLCLIKSGPSKALKSMPGSKFSIVPENVAEFAKGKVGGVCHYGQAVGRIAMHNGSRTCSIPAASFNVSATANPNTQH
jgi:stage V sporulation protein SpoVS